MGRMYFPHKCLRSTQQSNLCQGMNPGKGEPQPRMGISEFTADFRLPTPVEECERKKNWTACKYI